MTNKQSSGPDADLFPQEPNLQEKEIFSLITKALNVDKDSDDIENLQKEVKLLEKNNQFLRWAFGIGLTALSLVVIVFFNTTHRIDSLHGRIDSLGSQVNQIYQALKNSEPKEAE